MNRKFVTVTKSRYFQPCSLLFFGVRLCSFSFSLACPPSPSMISSTCTEAPVVPTRSTTDEPLPKSRSTRRVFTFFFLLEDEHTFLQWTGKVHAKASRIIVIFSDDVHCSGVSLSAKAASGHRGMGMVEFLNFFFLTPCTCLPSVEGESEDGGRSDHACVNSCSVRPNGERTRY